MARVNQLQKQLKAAREQLKTAQSGATKGEKNKELAQVRAKVKRLTVQLNRARKNGKGGLPGWCGLRAKK